ncbi:MAG: hypothetical protein U5K28_08890 [Halobacteriales archaeon]|nr:hypothetical protein [Halobacteriales archaeon]
MGLSLLQRLFGGLFVLLTGLVVVATLAPETVLQIPTARQAIDATADLDPKLIGLVVSIALGLVLAAILLFTPSPSIDDPTFDQYREAPPEVATAERGERVGQQFDTTLDRLSNDPTRLRKRLRPVAVGHYRAVSEDDPERAVATGTWTDSRPAAVFLGSEVSPTLFERLRRWLDPETEYRRRVAATVTAIDALGEEEP